MNESERLTLAVIGGGPAGRAAAAAAAELGIEATVFDQNDGTLVWLIDPDGTVCFNQGEEVRSLTARRVILAPGALPRPVPGGPPDTAFEVPDIQMTAALGLAHAWDSVQRFWYAKCGPNGGTEFERLYLAGAVTGQFGEDIAAWQGRRAAVSVARDLATDIAAGVLSDPPPAEPMTPKPLDAAGLDDEAIVCDCEGTTVADLHRLAAMGCDDVNQAKALGRPGAGPCQGRRCAMAVAEVLASALGVDVPDAGYFRQRWPSSPVALDKLAAFAELGDD